MPRSLLLILAVSAFVRGGVAEWVLQQRAQLPDSQLYEAYADSILRGGPYSDGKDFARRAPGYPLFIAAGRTLLGEQGRQGPSRGLLCIQAVLSTLTCYFTWRLGTHLEGVGFPEGTALAGAGLASLEPFSIVTGAVLLSETLFTTLLVASACFAVDSARARTIGDGVRWSAALGMSAGYAILVRPSGVLLAPIVALGWFAMVRPRPVVPLAIAILVALVVLAPWWIRNGIRFGRFVPTTLNVGESLYDGLNPDADGGSNMAFLERPGNVPAGEVERDRYWRDQAIQFAAQNPRRVLELAWIKLRRFWSPWPNADQFQRPFVVFATTAASVPILALAIWGCWRQRSHPALVAGLVLPAVYFCVLHLVFVSSVRYRVPAMPFLCLLAGSVAAPWIGRNVRDETDVRGAKARQGARDR